MWVACTPSLHRDAIKGWQGIALPPVLLRPELYHLGVSVFDEVDSGVGGRVGARIGHALRRLTSVGAQQVLCVTHLPQVAACGDNHLVVSKAPNPDADGRTCIDIAPLAARAERVEEISQMLGIGDVEGRDSAERLVDDAARAFA